MGSSVRECKRSLRFLFGTHFQNGLSTLKIYLLDNLVEDLDRFGIDFGQNYSPYEHSNLVMKQS